MGISTTNRAFLFWIIGSVIILSIWGFVSTSLFLFLGLALGCVIYAVLKSNKMIANDEMFEQAGVKVEFKTGALTINKKAYHVKQVTGIETKEVSSFRTIVYIKLDDFKTPLQTVDILDGGEKFVQRFQTALRKAGGPSFY